MTLGQPQRVVIRWVCISAHVCAPRGVLPGPGHLVLPPPAFHVLSITARSPLGLGLGSALAMSPPHPGLGGSFEDAQETSCASHHSRGGH